MTAATCRGGQLHRAQPACLAPWYTRPIPVSSTNGSRRSNSPDRGLLMAVAVQLARRITSAVTRRVAAVRANNDRGDIVGWAIMIPLSIALFLTAVQAAMWYQARNMCQAAAHAGTQAGKAYNAAGGAGSQAA